MAIYHNIKHSQTQAYVLHVWLLVLLVNRVHFVLSVWGISIYIRAIKHAPNNVTQQIPTTSSMKVDFSFVNLAHKMDVLFVEEMYVSFVHNLWYFKGANV